MSIERMARPWSFDDSSSLPNALSRASALSVIATTTSYRELAVTGQDVIVEYQVSRHGAEIVSHINYSLLRRVRRRRNARIDTELTRPARHLTVDVRSADERGSDYNQPDRQYHRS